MKGLSCYAMEFDCILRTVSVCKRIFVFGHAGWHVTSKFPDQGLNLQPLHWKHRVLTTGPPERSFKEGFLKRKYLFG